MADPEKNYIVNKITNDEITRKKIVFEICKLASCKNGEVFLIVKKNKFYYGPDLSNIIIYSYDKEGNESYESINNILPQKSYETMYDKVAFYIYCKAEKIEDVKKIFIEIINNFEKIIMGS